MPDWTPDLRHRLEGLSLSPAREAEIIEELSLHLETRFEELAPSHAADDARRLTLAELDQPGDLAKRLASLRQAHATRHTLPPPGQPRRHLLGDLLQDLRYAARMLRRQPGFTAAAVLTLGLGIGANTAVFGLVNAVLLTPPPVSQPDSLYFIGNGRVGGSYSYPFYAALRDRTDVLAGFSAFGTIGVSMNTGAETTLVAGQIVTGNYFPSLGVQPQRGRLLGPSDDVTPMAHPVVVLGHRLWQSQFGGLDDAVGRDLLLNGMRFTVVGVAPPAFRGLRPDSPADLFVPMMMQPIVRPPRGGYSGEMDPDLLGREDMSWLIGVGRLRPGDAEEKAEATLTTVATQVLAASRSAGPPSEPHVMPLTPISIVDPETHGVAVSIATLLFVVVGTVLLIACANVAGLLMSRAAARRSEIAVRLSLGASRGRLVRQLLTESVLLSLGGGVFGAVLALAVAAAFRAAPPSGVLPVPLDFPVDGQVLGFAATLSVVTGLIFGMAPALAASRPQLVDALKAGWTWGVRRRVTFRAALVVGQVAASVTLLVVAGLFLRSLQRMHAVEPGFDVDRLITAPLNVNLLRYTTDQGREFYRRAVEAVEGIPGVASATVARVGVLPAGGRTVGLVADGIDPGDGPHPVRANVIGTRFFETMGIPLLSGRPFNATDGPAAPMVAIVNTALVEREFGERNPVGQRIRLGPPTAPWIEVIGVVADQKYASLTESRAPILYLPLAQNHETGVTLIARTRGEPGPLVGSVRETLRALEPNLPATSVDIGRESLVNSMYPSQLGAVVLAAFGGLALVLAAVGVYGVLAFSIARRTREMGIRIALGAKSTQVFALVLREGLVLAVLGLAIGWALALAGAKSIESFLFGVQAHDVATFAVVPAVLLLTALVACVVPARRATAIDPTQALRTD